jgi:hypothetical protein
MGRVRLTYIREDNIKMNFRNMSYEDVNWTEVVRVGFKGGVL